MVLSRTKTQPYTSVLTQHAHLVHGIVQAVNYAWCDALTRTNEFRPPNDFGVQLYGNIVERVSRFLVEHGFEIHNKGCQVRLIMVDENLEQPLRILFCKGKKKGMDMCVGKKGTFSVELVRENKPLSSQPVLDFEFEEEPEIVDDNGVCQNYWLIWEPAKLNSEMFTLYLALPENCSPAATRFHCAELVELYSGSAFGASVASVELPLSTVVTPVVEEVEDSNGAG